MGNILEVIELKGVDILNNLPLVGNIIDKDDSLFIVMNTLFNYNLVPHTPFIYYFNFIVLHQHVYSDYREYFKG